MKKCVYCSTEINEDQTMEVCEVCGHQVWGKMMFNVIRKNMDEAREKGDIWRFFFNKKPFKGIVFRLLVVISKMVRRKSMRERGKIKFSEYFKSLKEGDRVAVKVEHSISNNIPKRIQGRNGTVIGKRGRSYIISLKELNKEKTFIIHPIHLKHMVTKND